MTSTELPQPAADWRALHVFVHHGPEQVEQLLTSTVHPWVTEALASGAITGWFMVRYWEGGPHLRLRLRDAGDQSLAELRQRVAGFLADQPRADPPLAPEQYYAAAAAPDLVAGELPWHADHSIVEFPYEPELARYGGPAGMPVCEQQFQASSEIAVATIRATPGRRGRLRAAADLLLASVWSTGMEWLGAAEWLRGYANSWTYVSEAPPPDVAAMRRAAEAAYLRDERSWLRHREVLRSAIESPTSAAGAWYRSQAASWARLTELRAAGELTADPVEVFQSLVHMLHNRLGLRLDEESYLAWLLSMPLVAHTPREPFFADGPAALDRQLHEQSKFLQARAEEQAPNRQAPSDGRQQFWPPMETVPLVRPDPPQAGSGPSFPAVLLGRRSGYGRYCGAVTTQELATLLYYAAGSTAEITPPGGAEGYRVRTYPSSGARFPIRLLAYCHNVSGLPRGTYLYDPYEHSLGRLTDRDLTAELLAVSPFLDLREQSAPIDAAECPLWLFLVADLTYQRPRYGLRAYRFVLLEAGHIAQNLSLVAGWLGHSSIGLGGFYDDAVNQSIFVDGVNSSVLYIYLVGHTQPLVEPAATEPGGVI